MHNQIVFIARNEARFARERCTPFEESLRARASTRASKLRGLITVAVAAGGDRWRDPRQSERKRSESRVLKLAKRVASAQYGGGGIRSSAGSVKTLI